MEKHDLVILGAGCAGIYAGIYAAGTFPARGSFEGESEFSGHGISCCAARDGRLFRGQVSLDENGYIMTDELMRAGLPGVFAAGDIRRKPLRRIPTAVSDGAVAAAGAEQFITGGA